MADTVLARSRFIAFDGTLYSVPIALREKCRMSKGSILKLAANEKYGRGGTAASFALPGAASTSVGMFTFRDEPVTALHSTTGQRRWGN